MLLNPPPHKETDRLRVLHQYDILDTPAEDIFDQIIRDIAVELKVPIALFCLIDDKRLWFKARVGLSIAEADHTNSFCGHVIATNSPLVIEDTGADATLAENPFVIGYPNVAFYAGVPVRSTDQTPLGTVCAIDKTPRKFPWEQFLKLKEAAKLVECQLEERLANNTVRSLTQQQSKR
jgi:GAF domain-containing protein